MASSANALRQAVKAYLEAIGGVGAVGTPELSHYTALDNLLDVIGAQLSPKVAAVVHPTGQGAGLPDLGLFALRSRRAAAGGSPDRGVIEVKGADADLDQTIASEQVGKYWAEYRLVLVTNLARVRAGRRGRGRRDGGARALHAGRQRRRVQRTADPCEQRRQSARRLAR